MAVRTKAKPHGVTFSAFKSRDTFTFCFITLCLPIQVLTVFRCPTKFNRARLSHHFLDAMTEVCLLLVNESLHALLAAYLLLRIDVIFALVFKPFRQHVHAISLDSHSQG